MDLFDQTTDKTKNWLPQDGTVNYYGKLLSYKEVNFYLNRLSDTIEWRNDEAVIFGKKIITKRKVAWYGEKPYEYTDLKKNGAIGSLSFGAERKFAFKHKQTNRKTGTLL